MLQTREVIRCGMCFAGGAESTVGLDRCRGREEPRTTLMFLSSAWWVVVPFNEIGKTKGSVGLGWKMDYSILKTYI